MPGRSYSGSPGLYFPPLVANINYYNIDTPLLAAGEAHCLLEKK
jgi:hypothetical protein